MFITCLLALVLVRGAAAQTDVPAQDIRAELPRDVRIVLLGVPSVKNARAALDNLARSLDELQTELAKDGPAQKTEQLKYRVFFRLGQLDDALAVLTQSLRDQERIKGLEEYRDFARSLLLHSETIAGYTGAGEAPLVSEDDTPPSNPTAANNADLVKQLKVEVSDMDRLLAEIELKAKPDEERKAQLEKDVGALGQFVFQIRNLTEDIRAAESRQGTVRIDSNEIVRGVQGLVEAIRDMKREKGLRPQPNSRDPLPLRSNRRDRARP